MKYFNNKLIGFTLVEVMAVITIISIAVVIALPFFKKLSNTISHRNLYSHYPVRSFLVTEYLRKHIKIAEADGLKTILEGNCLILSPIENVLEERGSKSFCLIDRELRVYSREISEEEVINDFIPYELLERFVKKNNRAFSIFNLENEVGKKVIIDFIFSSSGNSINLYDEIFVYSNNIIVGKF